MVAGAPLRIIFFGTPEFAVPTLDALIHSRHQLVGVVTQPDRPRGRGQRTVPSPVKARATGAEVVVLQPSRLKDDVFLAALKDLKADLGVVAAYGKILPETLIAMPRLGLINLHGSLLPRYRGAAPIHRAVMAGETETGVTIMRVVKALDAGPMMATAVRRIDPDETSETIERDLAVLGAPLLLSVVDRLAAGTAEEIPQDDSLATYAPRLTKEDGVVDWTLPARQIHDRIRGLHPWPHAFGFLDGRRFILLQSAIVNESAAAGPPGTVIEASPNRFVVSTGKGAVNILRIQPEGKRTLSANEFLAGHRIVPGSRFASRP